MAEYIFKRVNTKVNTVDSSIIFREVKSGLFNYKKESDIIEDVFGCCLYREAESVSYYNNMEFFVTNYIHNNILKYTGLKVNDYLNLTRPERFTIDKVCRDKMIEEQKIIEETKNKNKHQNVMYDDMGLTNA